MREKPRQQVDAAKPAIARRPATGRTRFVPLLWIALAAAGALVVLEAARQVLAPDLGVQRSFSLTTLLVAAVALVVGYLALRLGLRQEQRLGEALERADSELFDAARRTEAILQAAVDGVIVIDETGVILSLNAAVEQIFGYAASELVGKNVEILMPAPFREEHDSYLSNYRQTGRRKIIGIGREVVGRRKGGATFPMDLAVSEVMFESGRAFVGTIRDITERKRTERMLLESEQRFRSMVEDLPAGAVYREGDAVIMNRGAEKITGYSRQEIRTLDEWFDRLYGDSAPEIRERYEEARRSGFPSARTHQIESRDGGPRLVEFAAYLSDPGEVWLLQDVTDRERMEEELRRQKDFAEGLLQTAPAIVLVLDREGRITQFNQYLERLLGATLEEVKGRSWFDEFIPEHDRPAIRELFASCLESPSAHGAVNPIVSRQGEERLVAWWDKPVRDAEGRVTGVLAIGLDVTDRRALEDQLRQAQKMEAIGRLAGGVAHDFNTLLGSIMGYSEMILERDDLPEDALRQVEQIHRSGKRGAALTSQLLAFSRRQVLEATVVDLNRVVTGMADMLRRLIGEDIEFVRNLAPELWSVRVDANQIEQVILNLVVNAFDALTGGGRISIETRNDRRSGEDEVVLAVSDNGVGMDDETRRRAFEPFFTTKEESKGTGLGLAMVYGVVKQSRGSISVESSPGAGARFEVRLPREHAAPRAVTRSVDGSAPVPRGTETVLLVEDDPMFLEMLGEFLQGSGYRVLSAPGPTEALALVEEWHNPIQLAISDMVMPGMSGQEFARTLSARYPNTKLIMMSGYTEDALEDRGVERGATAFLQKPFSTKLLLKTIRSLLDPAETDLRTSDRGEGRV